MTTLSPILVTGAAGNVGAVGRRVVEFLRKKDLPVRAMVRSDDDRAQVLRALGAEVVVGDLTNPNDVVNALNGCKRVYFGMAVSASYLEAATIMTAAALEQKELEVLVNISQMTVSEITLTHMTKSPQQKAHWLAEQMLGWSKLPAVTVRPTVFLQHFFFTTWAADSIKKSGTIRLPLGKAHTSPVSTDDVAEVIGTILESPAEHIGKVYELTGPRSQGIAEMAKEYAAALGRKVEYVDVPFDEWLEKDFRPKGLPAHVAAHIEEMARLHADNRYDRLTKDVEKLTGHVATSVTEYVRQNLGLFE